jgi:alpha-glucosidase
MENTRATYDGLRRLAPDERAFVMTRASYAGGQRYAVTWTGDNSATWEHLKLSVQQLINLGLSGFSYSGADVSGFAGGPSADLLTRWFEIGAFYPVFRDHSAVNTPRVEPWVDGPEHLAIRRRFVEERYRLMPYLYALADENARFGDPILRPVFYDHPGALQMGCDQSWTFTLGRDLLIAPPPHPESPAKYDICLPPGGWYDYWTGLAEGTPGGAAKGETIQAVPALDRLPVFVRAGAILPRQPLVQSTAETPKGPLSLDVYPGPDCRGTIYLDDGHSMAFEKGAYLRQTVRCRITGAGLELDFGRREGTYRPWWREIAVTIHGRIAGGQATAGARDIAVRYDSHTRTETLVLPDMAEGHVTVH